METLEEHPEQHEEQPAPAPSLSGRKLLQVAAEQFEEALSSMDQHGHLVNVFRSEYHELYDALTASIEGASTGQEKIKKIKDELQDHRENIALLDTQREDMKLTDLTMGVTLTSLKQLIADLKDRATERNENSQKFTEEFEHAKELVERGADWTEEQEEERKKLVEESLDVNRQLDLKQRLHINLRHELENLTQIVEGKEQRVFKVKEQLREVEANCTKLRLEGQREVHHKNRLEADLVSTQEQVRREQALFQEKQQLLRQETERMAIIEGDLRNSKESMEKHLEEYDSLFQAIEKLSERLEGQVNTNKALELETKKRAQLVEKKKAETELVAKERAKIESLKPLSIAKAEKAEAERQKHEQTRDELTNEIMTKQSVELKGDRREAEALARKQADLAREKSILDRKYDSSERATNLVYDLEQVNKASLCNLKDEVESFAASIKAKRQVINQLVMQRSKHEQNAEAHNKMYLEHLEEIKLQDMEAAELQRKTVFGQGRLKQQQNLYEAVRSDRNTYSKNLIEVQDDIKVIKRKFRNMTHHIEQLKEEIILKDSALVKEHFQHHCVDKERDLLRNEVAKIRKQIASSELIISNQRAEVQKLSEIIQEADDERQRQFKERDAIASEKSILSWQLTKRNDELAVLYEKLKVQLSALHRGEVRYMTVCGELKAQQDQIATMTQELAEATSQVKDTSKLKMAEKTLENDVLYEKRQVKGLQEELEVPLNVHRWRSLESTDPECFEMVCKLQSLQKRLIAKTELVLQKDLKIQECEKTYVELRNVLAKQPGPEVSEQLLIYQTNLKEKQAQMKAMEAELAMYRQQVELFKEDLSRCNGEMTALQEDWVKKALAFQRQDTFSAPHA